MAVSVVASVHRRGSVDGRDASTPGSGADACVTTVTFSATPGSTSGFGRSASIQRRESLLRKRLPNKSSPFVGTFRHAPPSSSSTTSTSTVFRTVLNRGNTSPQFKPARPNSLAEAKELFRSPSTSSVYGPSSLHMEASPYVGMFRHAPSTSLGNIMKKRQCSNSSLRDMIDFSFTSDSKKHIKLSSTPDMATERMHARGGDGENANLIYVDGRLPGGQPLPDRRIARGSTENTATNQATFPPLTFLDQRISSSLQSNLNSALNTTCTNDKCTSGKRFNDAASYSTSTSAFAGNAETPSATLGILDRLVHWLLFPMTNSTVPGAVIAFPAYDQHQGRIGYGLLNAILPFFHSFIKNILLLENGKAEEGREASISTDDQQNDENSVSSSESDQDGMSSVASSDASDASGFVSPLASSPQDHAAGGLAQLLALDVSVSSLAERYYAHEAFKELVGSSSMSSGVPSSSPGASGVNLDSSTSTDPLNTNAPLSSSPESLDYVITQIDIARMVRNASRHLDVESILSLPTVTYKSKKKQSEEENRRKEGYSNEKAHYEEGTTSNEEDTNDEDLNWSWMMVGEMDGLDECESPSPEAPGTPKPKERDISESGDAPTEEGQLISDIDEDTCVICLEHFNDGDRLRVLPCDHSFHVGCIDKWLSGSLSDEECFTSGCPTCKKHPVPIYEEDDINAGSTTCSNDGSVPSWAFARLGGVLAYSGSTSSH